MLSCSRRSHEVEGWLCDFPSFPHLTCVLYTAADILNQRRPVILERLVAEDSLSSAVTLLLSTMSCYFKGMSLRSSQRTLLAADSTVLQAQMGCLAHYVNAVHLAWHWTGLRAAMCDMLRAEDAWHTGYLPETFRPVQHLCELL